MESVKDLIDYPDRLIDCNIRTRKGFELRLRFQMPCVLDQCVIYSCSSDNVRPRLYCGLFDRPPGTRQTTSEE
jgi:hypothetical protein